MPTLHHQLLRDLCEPHVDAFYGEKIFLTPMKTSPNGRPKIDPEYGALEMTGTVVYPTSEFGVEMGVRKSYREANDLRSVQTGAQMVISFDNREFQKYGYEPRQGDRIDVPGRPKEPPFDVVSTRPDGTTRTEIHLVKFRGNA